MHQRDGHQHHLLVSCHEIIEEFLGLLPLLLHVVRDHRREIVVHVLFALILRYVGFNAKHPLLYVSYSHIHRHRHYVDRQHHVAAQVCHL